MSQELFTLGKWKAIFMMAIMDIIFLKDYIDSQQCARHRQPKAWVTALVTEEWLIQLFSSLGESAKCRLDGVDTKQPECRGSVTIHEANQSQLARLVKSQLWHWCGSLPSLFQQQCIYQHPMKVDDRQAHSSQRSESRSVWLRWVKKDSLPLAKQKWTPSTKLMFKRILIKKNISIITDHDGTYLSPYR